MKKGLTLLICLLGTMPIVLMAQDSYTTNLANVARIVPKFPDGDRSHYGLWAKDHLLDRPKIKSRFESPEDSIRKCALFMRYCTQAFEYYKQKDALNTVIYGDSALRTGFDNSDLYFYMGFCYEALGDYDRARNFFRTAKTRGFPASKFAYSEFKKRMKERKKAKALE